MKMRRVLLLSLSILFLPFAGCSRRVHKERVLLNPLFSSLAKADLTLGIRSIVQVENDVVYDVYEYPELGPRVGVDGRLLRRSREPVAQPIRMKKTETLSGAATIMLQRGDQVALLTSAHLVMPRDTVDSFYYDENGRLTDRLFRRAILKKSQVRVRSPDGWFHEAWVVAFDRRQDIAVLESRAGARLGSEFPFSIGYHLDLTWGDWVYVVGYPKGVKQLTVGVVSPSPYRGTLALSAVVRFGYSGGPVLAFDPLSNHLALVGMIKSVPYTQVDVVVPAEKLAPGEIIGEKRKTALIADRLRLIEFGSAYFVTTEALSEFFAQNLRKLESRNIMLSARFLP